MAGTCEHHNEDGGRLTRDDDGADSGAPQLRGLEDEDFGAKVEEREEIREQRQVIDAAKMAWSQDVMHARRGGKRGERWAHILLLMLYAA